MKTTVAVISTFVALFLLRPAGAEEWPVIPARISLVEWLPLTFERGAASVVTLKFLYTITFTLSPEPC